MFQQTVSLAIQLRSEVVSAVSSGSWKSDRDLVGAFEKLSRAGLYGDAEDLWPRVEARLVRGLKPALNEQVTVARAQMLLWAGRFQCLEEFAERQVGDSDSDLSLAARARLLATLTWGAHLQGDLDLSSDRAKRLFSVDLQGLSDLRAFADVCSILGYWSYYRDSDENAGRAFLDAAIGVYRLLDFPEQLTRVLGVRSIIAKSYGNLALAKELNELAAAAAAQAGDCDLLADRLVSAAIIQYRTGDIFEAERIAHDARRLLTSTSAPRYFFITALTLARIRIIALDPIGAGRWLAEARSEVDGVAWLRLRALLKEHEGMLMMLNQDFQGAFSLFEAAHSLYRSGGLKTYVLGEILLRKAEALIGMAEFSAAYDTASEGLKQITQRRQTLERGHLLRVKALAAYNIGRPTEAAELFEESEREIRRVGDLYELGRTLIDKAELIEDDAESRVADAAEAVNIYERIGIPQFLDHARDVLAMTQVALRQSQSLQIIDEGVQSGQVVAASKLMKNVLREARICAPSEGSVLILGETGVGKEVLARFVHDHSPRRAREFVAVNCAAIPDSLFEREFFGHAKGAFTGADETRAGLVELADEGTLFLDEVGELPVAMQPKLLRLIQEGVYRRVGDTKERRVDLRIVSATNRSLWNQVQEASFREDLYYRLAWFEVTVPPLRERVEDAVELAKYFLACESRRTGITYWVHKEAWQIIRRYPWPGNVRQLQAAIGSACARSGVNGCVHLEDLPPQVRRSLEAREASGPELHLATAIEKAERELILEALRKADHHRTEAARILGIGRNTLYEKMKKLGIRPER